MTEAEKKEEILNRQFRIAIDARDKLQDNYHKWMTFYYVANGAVLVAITTMYSKCELSWGTFLLSLLGCVICILWNLSCKGFYYWSKSWIHIIINMERQITKADIHLLAYGAFSKDVFEKENHPLNPFRAANISTPKLTLRFSFLSIVGWMSFGLIQLYNLSSWPVCCKISVSFGIFLSGLLIYAMLSNSTKSMDSDTHVLVPFEKNQKSPPEITE